MASNGAVCAIIEDVTRDIELMRGVALGDIGSDEAERVARGVLARDEEVTIDVARFGSSI